jgi:hypothetical protein
MMKKNMKTLFIFAMLTAGSFSARAISIDWTGGYRIEYVDIDRPTLSDPGGKKSYGLNYLYLQPKMIASDGINIVSRFDILSNEKPAYRNSQLGSFIGSGLDTTGGAGANTTAQNSESSNVRVSQLYLNVNHEYGSLVAGRAPIEFGLGITHNAGLGAFDHWYDSKDMVGYKFIVDNISFMPIISRNQQSSFEIGKTVSDQIFVFEYNNKDIGAKAGVFWQNRNTSDQSNDALNSGIPGATTISGGYSSKTVNMYLERKWTAFEFKLEASFLTGQTGAKNASSEEIGYNSYAVATEMLMPAVDSSWEFATKLGVVSGDNPTTANFEGYQIDRNYDVAILLFNHRMGRADFFNTGILHANDGVGGNGLSTVNSADDEAIGNAMYLAPSFKYLWNEKLDLKTSVIYAQLMTNPNNFVDFKKDLGLELDIELIYKPRERVTWSTGLGILSPGSAWSGGSGNNWDTKMNYGFTTKAAITF